MSQAQAAAITDPGAEEEKPATEDETTSAALFEEFAQKKQDTTDPSPEMLADAAKDPTTRAESAPSVPNENGGSDASAAAAPVGGDNAAAENPIEDKYEGPDILKAASPEIQALFSSQQKQFTDLMHRAKSDSNRVSSLHSKIRKMELTEQGQKVMSPKDFVASFKSKDAWNRFVEENPDAAEVFGEFMQGMTQNADAHLAQSQQNTEQMQEARNVVENQANRVEITAAFPEWEQWTASGDFYRWIDNQPAIIKGMLDDESLEDSLTLLSLYENHRIAHAVEGSTPRETPLQQQKPATSAAKIKQKRSKQLADGLQTPATGGSVKPIPEANSTDLFNYFVEKKARENSARGGYR